MLLYIVYSLSSSINNLNGNEIDTKNNIKESKIKNIIVNPLVPLSSHINLGNKLLPSFPSWQVQNFITEETKSTFTSDNHVFNNNKNVNVEPINHLFNEIKRYLQINQQENLSSTNNLELFNHSDMLNNLLLLNYNNIMLYNQLNNVMNILEFNMARQSNTFNTNINALQIKNSNTSTENSTLSNSKTTINNITASNDQSYASINIKNSLEKKKHLKRKNINFEKKNKIKSPNLVKTKNFIKNSIEDKQANHTFKFIKNNATRKNISNFYIDYSIDDINKLVDYSIKDINLDELYKDLVTIQIAIYNELICDKDRFIVIYDSIIKILCNTNENKIPILKKSFILLSYCLCELIPFIEFFKNNYENLMLGSQRIEKTDNIINELLYNLKNLIKKYHTGLINLRLMLNKNTDDLTSIYVLGRLNDFLFDETKAVRYSLASLNEFLTKDTKIINFYWHFVTKLYTIKHGCHDKRTYEIVIFFAYIINNLNIDALFRNANYDIEKKSYIVTNKLSGKYISSLFTFKYIIDQINMDAFNFYERLNHDYFKKTDEVNHTKVFEYINTHISKIYLKNIKVPCLSKNEYFYVTNCDYLMNVYLHVFSKMIKYALIDTC